MVTSSSGSLRVLIVEDELSVARFLHQAVREAGHTAEVLHDGTAVAQAAATGDFDMVLLDVMLPGMDGLEVCRRLRGQGFRAPILMLTARDTLQDKVQGLDAGADDYIVKPFALAELLARIRALARRSRGQSLTGAALQVEDLVLDPSSHRVTRGGEAVHLSATEFALLEYLMRKAGRVVTRRSLLEHVWDYDFEGNDNVLHVYISYLRSKIDRGHPRPLIHTVRGVGYRVGQER